jgi:hypothetical protein
MIRFINIIITNNKITQTLKEALSFLLAVVTIWT